MSQIRAAFTVVLASLAYAIGTPANACDTGPWPIAFVSRTPELTRDSRRFLEALADMRGVNGKDLVLVRFYGPTPRREAEVALQRKRQQSIRAYLQTKGVPLDGISFVRRKQQLPANFAEPDNGFRPIGTAQLKVGCRR